MYTQRVGYVWSQREKRKPFGIETTGVVEKKEATDAIFQRLIEVSILQERNDGGGNLFLPSYIVHLNTL